MLLRVFLRCFGSRGFQNHCWVAARQEKIVQNLELCQCELLLASRHTLTRPAAFTPNVLWTSRIPPCGPMLQISASLAFVGRLGTCEHRHDQFFLNGYLLLQWWSAILVAIVSKLLTRRGRSCLLSRSTWMIETGVVDTPWEVNLRPVVVLCFDTGLGCSNFILASWIDVLIGLALSVLLFRRIRRLDRVKHFAIVSWIWHRLHTCQVIDSILCLVRHRGGIPECHDGIRLDRASRASKEDILWHLAFLLADRTSSWHWDTRWLRTIPVVHLSLSLVSRFIPVICETSAIQSLFHIKALASHHKLLIDASFCTMSHGSLRKSLLERDHIVIVKINELWSATIFAVFATIVDKLWPLFLYAEEFLKCLAMQRHVLTLIRFKVASCCLIGLVIFVIGYVGLLELLR